MVLGPCVGAAIDVYGQHPVLLVLGAFLTSVAIFGLWSMSAAGALDGRATGEGRSGLD